MFRRTANFHLLICLFVWSAYGFAQNKQANNWYFGQYAGITFNTVDGSPEALYDGMINQNEGCASISDTEGNLLFYTNGMTVWNHLHFIMQNGTGLTGHTSASMSGLIVPWPNHDDHYFILSVDECGGSNGLCYSIVDMSLDNGLGAVTDVKNIPLAGPVHEMVTSVLHENGKSIWVISHLWQTNTFISFLIDQDSLHSNPILCNAGMVHSASYVANGYMKASMQGNKIAIAQADAEVVQLFDFDNATAQLSNPITIPRFETNNTYGVEFSPDGSKLYVSSFNGSPSNENMVVTQFDLSSDDSAAIVNSEYIVAQITGASIERFGGIQIGPDEKIYIARRGCSYLSIINNPNLPGAFCDYENVGINLTDGSGVHQAMYGLPAFIQSFFNPANFSWEGQCIGDTTFFAIADTAAQDSVYWDFGDVTTGILNNSTSFFPYHIYSDTGNFQVSVIGYNNSLNDTTVQDIYIHPLPEPLLPADTGFCEGYGVHLWPGEFQSYLWQNGSTDTSFYADTTSSIIVEVTDIHGCKATDSTHAVEHSKPEATVIYHD